MTAFRAGWPEQGIAILALGVGFAVGFPAYNMLEQGQSAEISFLIAGFLTAFGIAFGCLVMFDISAFAALKYQLAGFALAWGFGSIALRESSLGWKIAFAALAALHLGIVLGDVVLLVRSRASKQS